MGNYSLIAGSTFKPFTYQELMAPVLDMSNYHEKIADEYDKLSSQADVLEAMGANDRDKGAYKKYKAYSDSLRTEADNLAKFGIDSESRQRLSDLRRRYNTDIVPIQNAWNKREEEAKMQQNALLSHPELRFTRTASDTPLDEYIANPNGGFGVVNLNTIAAQMSEAAKNLAKQKRDGYKMEDIDPFTRNLITSYGLDPNLVAAWQNNPDISPTLTGMMNEVLAANGLNEDFLQTPNGKSIYNEAIGAIQRGAWSAVGEDKAQVMENWKARQDDTFARQKALERYKKALEGPQPTELPALPGETVPINFNDPESAGNNMKRRMAEATLAYLQQSKTKAAKEMLAKINKDGVEATLQKWQTEGINGDDFKKDNMYYGLGNYLRENVTKNENLINIWRSSYTDKDKLTDTGKYALSESRSPLNPTVVYPKYDKVPANTKNWGKFDDEASNGYQVKAIALNDNPDDLKKFLADVITRNTRNGKTKLYDIKKISGNNEYTYSKEGLELADLPHTSNGKDIKFDDIHRMMLSNGDYLLYWLDSNGNQVQKVLKRSDVGEQAARDWANTDKDYKNAVAMYADGKITAEQLAHTERTLGINNMGNAYRDTQRVDVKPVEIKN